MDNAQVKRKHFRFPAYDDEQGVKLPTDNERNLFQDDRLVKQCLVAEELQHLPKILDKAHHPSNNQQRINQLQINKHNN